MKVHDAFRFQQRLSTPGETPVSEADLAPPARVVRPPAVEALYRYLPADKVGEAARLLPAALDRLEMVAAELYLVGEQAARKPLESDQQEAAAVELMSRGVIALRELDALRRARVDPLNAEVKAVNALTKVLSDPAEAMVGTRGTLERLILAYRQVKSARIERERAEARRRQEEAARAEAAALEQAERAQDPGERQAAMDAAEAASQAQASALIEAPREMTRGIRTDSGSVSARERWLAEVVDPALVPRAYLIPDERAIRAAVAAGVRDIPGVAITLEEALTRRVG
jgi:flagellar hook-length control protein FliK